MLRRRPFFAGASPRVLLGWAAAALLLVLSTGCASSASVTGSGPSSTAAAGSVEQDIRAEVERWRGAPYRLGGISRQGVDCSGFVMALYERVFGVDLPRTTEEQVRAGQAVRQRDLRVGDLVFFRPTAKTRHVGVYLSNERFAHASSSQGVTISRLDQPYWQRRYWTARRVLDALPPEAATAARAAAPPPPPIAPPEGRGGW